MSSQKIESDNNQIKNKREETNNKNPSQQQKEQQAQQITEHTIATTATISKTTNEVTNRINENQKINKAILDKSIDITNRYQQQIIKAIKETTNNYNQLQKNILNTYQSTFSRFFDNASKSNWNTFLYPQQYTDAYNKTNKNVTDHTINCLRRLNEYVNGSTETFGKSIEIAQKYYNESVQNYLNFVNKIGRSYTNQ